MLSTATPIRSGSWKTIPPPPFDPVFGIRDLFYASKIPGKQSLTVGTLSGNDGRLYSFPSVMRARAMVSQDDVNYLPMEGHPGFIKQGRDLLLGPNDPGVSLQTLGGTGGLFLSSAVYKQFLGDTVVVSVPSWPNHFQMFDYLGLKQVKFPALTADRRFNRAGMLEAMQSAPDGSLVLLQVCGHNPTGADPTPEEFREVFEMSKKKDHIMLLDVAYVGYVHGNFQKETEPVREFAKLGRPGFISLSFSKCMGLYGERLGMLSFTGDHAQGAWSQAKYIARGMYSIPTRCGADTVSKLLSIPRLTKQWGVELKAAFDRLNKIRREFTDKVEKVSGKDWSHVREGKGFFAWSGLTEKQVLWLHSQGVFIPLSGRIAIPALNPTNIDFVSEKMGRSLKIA